jgi:hypothetical protein
MDRRTDPRRSHCVGRCWYNARELGNHSGQLRCRSCKSQRAYSASVSLTLLSVIEPLLLRLVRLVKETPSTLSSPCLFCSCQIVISLCFNLSCPWLTDSSSNLSQPSPSSPQQLPTNTRPTIPTVSRSRQVDDYQSILAAAASLESRLARWPKSVPPSWQPITVSSTSCIDPSIMAAGLYGATCDIYPSINIAGLWNWYRTLRISTIKIIMLCQRGLKQNENLHSTTQHFAETVQVLIDEFCASIPFHLGNRNGPMLSHELRKVTYPSLPIQSLTGIDGPRCATATSTAEHKRAAGVSGAWFVLDPLSDILKSTASSPFTGPGPASQYEHRPLLQLRQGQREWLMGQMMRVQSMNLYGRAQSSVSSPKTSSNSTSTPSLSTASLSSSSSSPAAKLNRLFSHSRQQQIQTTLATDFPSRSARDEQ